ncbi:MAG: hypothetical protein Q7J32_19275 [Sphingomonadaceae bacterium]|nr:hypothetical protein [Sphingomonadaceae bacterium]
MNEIDGKFVKRQYNLSSGGTVEIEISFPEGADMDWYCEYSIQWLGESVRSGKRPGIDPLDALFNSVKIVAVDLNEKAEKNGVIITWDGNPDIGLSL